MRTDTWGDVVNGPETYAGIALELKEGRSIVLGWADGRSSHMDILFTAPTPMVCGMLQGLHPSLAQGRAALLFVSVMRRGCFAFPVYADETLHHEYVAEKLNVGGATAEALAQLINGVLDTLRVAAP